MSSPAIMRMLAFCLALLVLGGCAGKQDKDDSADLQGEENVQDAGTVDVTPRNPEDPWEGYNRAMFKFNDGFDRFIFLPLAKGYSFIIPEAVNQGLTNFFANWLMPVTMVNDVFQLKFKAFAEHTGRFLLNTTVGVVGFIDVASKVGLEEEPEDFGQTLGWWGVKPGPYVVLPFLGGRTVRDTFGMIPDYALSVYSEIDNVPLRNSLMGLSLIDRRADLIPAEQLITGDRYIFLRDAYLQQRRYLIADGQLEDDFGEDDFEDDFDDDFDEAMQDDFDDDAGAGFSEDFEE